MRVIIKGTHIQITSAVRTYLEEKIVKSLRKFFRDGDTVSPLVDIEFERTTRHHHKGQVWRAEANVKIGKRILRAEASGEDPREAIDVLEEEIVHEVRSFKEKNVARSRASARNVKKQLRGA